MSAHLTTHVLDASAGAPAAGVHVALTTDDTATVAEGVTDADGRLALGPQVLEPGVYALTFDTGGYFAQRGVPTFYPRVTVAVSIADAEHYHVPLLLSPFAYSTYRGS